MLRSFPQCSFQPSPNRASLNSRWQRNANNPPHRNTRCTAQVVTGGAYEDIIDALALRALQRSLICSEVSSNSDSNNNSTNAPAVAPELSVRRVIIGIAGGPGSGKSTLAAAVAARINQLMRPSASPSVPMTTTTALPKTGASTDDAASGTASADPGAGGDDAAVADADYAVVLPMDGFHYYRRELDAMPNPKEAHARRGAPWTFDAAKFVDAVRRVRQAGCSTPGSVVRVPSFDHGVGDPVEDDITIAPESAVVLVEGNYVFLSEAPWCELRPLLDEAWFVECPLDVAMQRVYERQTSIGLAPEVSRTRIATNDRPNAELVAASAAAADLCVSSTVPFKRTANGGV